MATRTRRDFQDSIWGIRPREKFVKDRPKIQERLRTEVNTSGEETGPRIRWEIKIVAREIVFLSEKFVLPSTAPKLLDVFKKLEALSELPRGWDDEGSPPPHGALLKAVGKLLVMYFDAAWSINHAAMFVPNITPLSNGSIDVYWRNDSKHLLLNLAAEDGQIQAEFFAQELGSTEYATGPVGITAVNPNVLFWLRQF